MSVTVDKTDQPYEYGDYVTITGSGAAKSSKITIKIIPPDDSKVQKLSFFSTSAGDFSTLFLIPDDATHGTYTIEASDSTQSGSTTFYVYTESELNNKVESSSFGSDSDNYDDSDTEYYEEFYSDYDSHHESTVNPLAGPTCNDLIPTIVGSNPNGEKIEGTEGDDVIVGTPGPDDIDGKGGNDTICGGDGDDKIDGGNGNDKLFGGDGNDKLKGGKGNDE